MKKLKGILPSDFTNRLGETVRNIWLQLPWFDGKCIQMCAKVPPHFQPHIGYIVAGSHFTSPGVPT